MLWMVAGTALAVVLGADAAYGHCDGLDGPVVSAARAALAQGQPEAVLMWVQTKDEAEIRDAFTRTLAVRKHGGPAQELADQWFFETLVRVHRAGEGAPYTGLKPAGRDLGPALPAADRALVTGNAAPLEKLLQDAVQRGVREQFERAHALHKHAPNDVPAGRRYVAAYVPYIHFVERLYTAATTPIEGHEVAEAEAAPHAHEH
jgi:hypothetical protein